MDFHIKRRSVRQWRLHSVEITFLQDIYELANSFVEAFLMMMRMRLIMMMRNLLSLLAPIGCLQLLKKENDSTKMSLIGSLWMWLKKFCSFVYRNTVWTLSRLDYPLFFNPRPKPKTFITATNNIVKTLRKHSLKKNITAIRFHLSKSPGDPFEPKISVQRLWHTKWNKTSYCTLT